MNEIPRPLAGFLWDDDDWGGVVRYGPLVADERELRLLGNPAGRRVLLLGCGAGQLPAALASAAARVIAVDPSAEAVAATRRHGAAHGLAVEAQQRDLAELAFVRAETIDVAVSLFALQGVADLGRVFRQVHRVLRADAPVVLSLPHPVLGILDVAPRPGALRDLCVVGTYGESRTDVGSTDAGPRDIGSTDAGPVTASTGPSTATAMTATPPVTSAHTIEAVVTALTRGGFRIDTLLELMARPDPGGRPGGPAAYWHPAMERVPAVLVVRARKVGL